MANPHALPLASGIGLKPEHYRRAIGAYSDRTSIRPNWVEVHPQNYFCLGGPPHLWLTAFAEACPLSFHSTGLSLGSAQGIDLVELDQLASLVDRYQPASVSDHLSWSNADGQKFPDLLPVPYASEALDHMAEAIDCVQNRLRRTILIENPSRYLAFSGDTMDEVEFIQLLCRRAGCGLLLDINNIDVSANNLGFDALDYLDRIDPALVGEIHVAGHATEFYDDGTTLKIDDHGSPVSDRCWELLARFIARAGPRPVLVERDTNIPDYDELVAEMQRAQIILEPQHVPQFDFA